MKNRILILISLVVCNIVAFAQQTLDYQLPSSSIANIINTDIQSEISLNPTKTWLMIVEKRNYSSLNTISEKELKLAGLRINPDNNFPSRINSISAIKFKKVNSDTAVIKIKGLSADASIAFPKWSPDGEKVAFCQIFINKVELYLYDISKQKLRMLNTGSVCMPIDYNPIVWMPDSKHILCLNRIDNKEQISQNEEKIGPVVMENDGKSRPSLTYQDLLQSLKDELLFEYYLKNTLIKINIENGKQTIIQKNSIFQSFDPSPDGKYILVKTVQKPYSYKTNVLSFPSKIEIFSANGHLVKEVVNLPVLEKTLGKDATVSNPRAHAWRLDDPATIFWIQALDEGNPEKKVDFRDEILLLEAPFNLEQKTLYKTRERFYNIFWGSKTLAIVAERKWKTRTIKWIKVNPDDKSKIDTLETFSTENVYDSPGEPYQDYNSFGKKTLVISQNTNIFLSKYQYSEKHGILPYLVKYNTENRITEKIWQSTPPNLDYFIGFFEGFNHQIIARQTSREPNNYFISSTSDSVVVPLTYQKSPIQSFTTSITKKELKYKRADGVDLNATLYYVPRRDSPQNPLPTLMWGYPIDFKSKKSASQNFSSPYSYVGYYNSQMLMAIQGYAVLDFVSFPIVSEDEKEANDTYLKQIYLNAKAAIDEGVRLGIVDSSKVAIAGHSYGAFLVANLLTHTNLFKTGIAQSGAYNRTLTPFGFQSETRTYWQKPDLYNNISPFQNADKLKHPILLIHGDSDNNTGTHVLQSERYFDALRGLGAHVRLVKLPYESHIYQARESVLHLCWEMNEWLEKHLISKSLTNYSGK
jgi:dipeptidyl aminopeptidase/acylaminoacyl peptidase